MSKDRGLIIVKATGIVRRIDELGRIVLPVELRRVLEISERDALEIFVEDNKVILQKYHPACIFCGSKDGLRTFHDHQVCEDCCQKMSNLDS